MSYAGTPTSRSEFILSQSTPSFSHPAQHLTGSGTALAMTTTSASGNHPPSMSVSTSGLPQQPHHHHFYPQPIYESMHVSSPSLHHHRDSLTSSKGSLTGGNEALDQQRGDVMSQRIKKSFEQKEEFLKRPALPYWVNVQEANQTAPAVPREFYAQPQKFARPVWPPTNPSSSFESLPESPGGSKGSPAPIATPPKTSATSTPVITAVEPWSMVFTSSKGTPPGTPISGLVTNAVPKPFYGSASGAAPVPPPTTSPTNNKLFISTLTRIQENIPSVDPTIEQQQQRRLDLELKPK